MSILLSWILEPLVAMHVALAVPGFAQTDVSLRTVSLRSSVDVAREYRPLAETSPDDVELPKNLIVPALYRELVESMRLRSATFRRQCLRIASESRLTVVLEAGPPPAHLRALAWTRVARVDGRLDAVIRLGKDYPAPGLIAHELEHVIEQLDGVDLQRKSRLDSTGVHECMCGGATAFETARAVRAGLQVTAELRAHRR
ncbi:MAG TPA: hypothetical protein VHI99_22500 [Vicinamibacterales bacterium]|jgi:hypothetical protein|nr:hypothetical protein [Vicinamibacterales bacterium]